MTDDIISRLKDIASLRGPMAGSVIPVACLDAIDEIERLRKMAWLMAGHISTEDRWEKTHPESIYKQFYMEARNG